MLNLLHWFSANSFESKSQRVSSAHHVGVCAFCFSPEGALDAGILNIVEKVVADVDVSAEQDLACARYFLVGG